MKNVLVAESVSQIKFKSDLEVVPLRRASRLEWAWKIPFKWKISKCFRFTYDTRENELTPTSDPGSSFNKALNFIDKRRHALDYPSRKSLSQIIFTLISTLAPLISIIASTLHAEKIPENCHVSSEATRRANFLTLIESLRRAPRKRSFNPFRRLIML